MKLPKKGQKGFTLIELLIVVAILGVLAAVVIPNIGQFIGAGEEEAKDTEFSNVGLAIDMMRTQNELVTIPTPIILAADRTNDMNLFPDITASATVPVADPGKVRDPNGDTYDFVAGDLVGYVLFQHDITADGLGTGLVNYFTTQYTAYWYTVNAAGTVTQYDTAP